VMRRWKVVAVLAVAGDVAVAWDRSWLWRLCEKVIFGEHGKFWRETFSSFVPICSAKTLYSGSQR
jgi:hypothetical protein